MLPTYFICPPSNWVSVTFLVLIFFGEPEGSKINVQEAPNFIHLGKMKRFTSICRTCTQPDANDSFVYKEVSLGADPQRGSLLPRKTGLPASDLINQ